MINNNMFLLFRLILISYKRRKVYDYLLLKTILKIDFYQYHISIVSVYYD